MAVRRISTVVAIDGEAEYKQSITNINASLKTLKSELAVVESAYAGNTQSAEALRAKQEALTAIQAKQVEKVDALKQALENAKTAQATYAQSYDTCTANIEETKAALEALRQETGDTSAEEARLTAQLEAQRQQLGEITQSQEATTRGVESWQQQLNYVQRDLNLTNNAIEETNEALDSMTLSLDGVETGCKSASENLTKVGSTMSTAVTLPLLDAGAAAVSYASDTEESLNKVAVAFGDSASQVTVWSETTLTAYGLARGTALDMTALYGDMATSMGYSQEAAAEMSMELVGLAADLASFKNISIDEANTALKSIFTGETESLKNLGVVMTEVNLESFALAQGIETAYSAMDQGEKVALRYEYVMASTENAQGDFSRTADGTANQLRILQESLKETAATMGEDLLPIVTPIIAKLGELTQSFATMDESTRDNLVSVGLFLAALGPALTVTGQLAGVISSGVAAYKALKTAQAAATASQTALNVAMASNPVGIVVTGISALIAVMAAMGVSYALTTEKVETLADTLHESQEAYQDMVTAVETQNADVSNMVSALMSLESQEGKTNAQKEAMLALVEDLNEAVPDLSLAYDAQNDSLNLTAERIQQIAKAEMERQLQAADIERLTELYQEQAEIESALADALLEQTQAQTAYQEKLAESATVSGNYQQELSNTMQRVYDADDAVEQLTAQQGEHEIQVSALVEKYGEQEVAQQDATQSTQDLTQAQETATTSTADLITAVDTLTSALDEQSDAGTLSLDTTLSLIEAGYTNALSIDTQTGSITLNKDAYIQLTKAKVAEQQASIDAQIASASATITAKEEAYHMAAVTQSYLLAAEAKAELSDAKEELTSLEAQKAALVALTNTLDNYTVSVVTTATTTTTQAQKDLQTFQALQSELEHQRTMDEISQEDYYKTLAQYRDDYLTDDDNLDEYRSITEEIYEYDKELADNEQTLWESQTDALTAQLQSRMDEILAKQEAMADKLTDYGDLFEINDDALSLSNLQDQVDIMEQYRESLERLKESGISDGLLEEVLAMDVDDALAYSQALLGMSPEQFEEYNELWAEKQQRALEISAEFYAEEARLAEEEFKDSFAQVLDETKTDAYQGGADTVQGIIDGIESKMPALSAAISKLQSMLSLETSLAEETQVDGSHAGGLTYVPYDGYIAELHQGERVLTAEETKAYVAQSTPQSLSLTTDTKQYDLAATMVNGIASAVSQMTTTQQSGGTIHVHLDVGEKELASVVYEPLKDLKKRKGE